MNRLQSELHRLYALAALAVPDATDAGDAQQVDACEQVRAMVLELGSPADWAPLSAVWQGVQTEFNLPAPAIAVNGKDGYQLWFSLAEALPADQASAFLQALCAHFLPDVAPERIGLTPAPGRLTTEVPPQEKSADQWSAFVATDLAPVFADAPWLDLPPSPEGQADLLSRLVSIQRADLQAAIARLTSVTTGVDANRAPARTTSTAPDSDPKRFLLGVMHDDTVALRWRIEAAKALLPYFDSPR